MIKVNDSIYLLMNTEPSASGIMGPESPSAWSVGCVFSNKNIEHLRQNYSGRDRLYEKGTVLGQIGK